MQLTRRILRTDQSVDDKILGVLERLGQAHRSFLQELATRNGLTPLQVQVVTVLGEGPPPLPYVGDIARELGITQPSASDAVAALEAEGLRLPGRRRQRSPPGGARPSPSAAMQLDEHLVRDRRTLRTALGAVAEEERGAVLVALQRVMTAFSEAGVVPERPQLPHVPVSRQRRGVRFRCNFARESMTVGRVAGQLRRPRIRTLIGLQRTKYPMTSAMTWGAPSEANMSIACVGARA